MAQTKIKMAVDPFSVIANALVSAKTVKVPHKIVSIDYDDEADVLYVKFKHAKIVDNSSIDEEGLVLASLDENGKIIGLMIMEASKFASKSLKVTP